MSLLIATTTVTIETSTADPGDAPSWSTRSSGIAAHVSSPSVIGVAFGSTQGESIDALVYLPYGTVVEEGDRITTAQGQSYRVVGSEPRYGLGLDHVVAHVRREEGSR